MESYDLSLCELLKKRPYLFEIPNYQRNYVWTAAQIEEYLKDITYCYESNSIGEKYDHFFGQMIFRKSRQDKSLRQVFEVVDGQQRLTTMTLTVAALYRLILLNAETIDDSVKSVLKELKEIFISNPDCGSTHRKLTLSQKDNGILVEIATVKEERIDRDFTYEFNYESEERILKAYLKIFDYFEKYFNDCELAYYADNILMFITTILENISVVVLMPENIGYSYALYQIVNDRGVLLTPAELLKARTMELLNGSDELFNECEIIWNDILNDAGNETTKYLMWHYASIIHATASKAKLNEIYEKKLFNCYGKHKVTDTERQELAENIRLLHQSVKWCRKLIIGEIPTSDLHPQIQNMYSALVLGLKNEIAIPIYINILKIQKEETRNKILSFVTVLLSKFFYSTRTISAVHNGTITKTYNYLSSQIATNKIDFEQMCAYCRKVQRDKGVVSVFTSKMSERIYYKTNTTTSKYLLYLLELYDKCDDVSYRHILSRDESSTVTFEKLSNEHIASFSGADGNKLTETERNSIGNLTPLGRKKNTDLDDKSFDVKKEEYLNSPYYLTREVAKNIKWEKEEFDVRQDELKQKALKIFLI